MARIVFDDKSYVHCYKSDNPGKIMIVISAKDSIDPLKKISNGAEMTEEEFRALIADVAL